MVQKRTHLKHVRNEFRQLNGNKFCSVRFTKRENNAERRMVFLPVISKDMLKGKGKSYDDADYNLQTVMEITREGRKIRSFAWDRVISMTFNGVEHVIK